MAQERRQHRRLRLHVPVAAVSGFGAGSDGRTFRSHDVSVGGLCVEVPAACAPAEGADIAFEITVPPGEGYSASPSRFRGAGQVVRREMREGQAVALAVQFTQPLALNLGV